MARKKYDEETENHERWLISYADFITLLFAFFVVMYAISVVNVGKYQVLSNSLGSAFGGKPATPQASSTVEELPLASIIARKRLDAARRDRERLHILARSLTTALAPLVKDGKVTVTQTAQGVKVDINASVLFAEGQAQLGSDARATLGMVAALLHHDTHALQVEGHTDNRPIANSAYPSNWELSAVRASSVVRLFIENGIDGARLTAVGHGANRPVAPNDNETGRARNRRVAITILAAAQG